MTSHEPNFKNMFDNLFFVFLRWNAVAVQVPHRPPHPVAALGYVLDLNHIFHTNIGMMGPTFAEQEPMKLRTF